MMSEFFFGILYHRSDFDFEIEKSNNIWILQWADFHNEEQWSALKIKTMSLLTLDHRKNTEIMSENKIKKVVNEKFDLWKQVWATDW